MNPERRLDQRITLERNINDQYGVEDWRPLFDCWAAIGTGINQTMWISAGIVGRYSLTVRDRVIWRGAVYHIKEIEDQGRGHLTALIVNVGSHG